MPIGSKALIPNPALKPFAVMIGEWETTGHHPIVPDTVLHGRVSIAWAENGAFLIMRTEIYHDQFPDGIAIFGSDDVAGTYGMLYFDERGVSRRQEVSVEDHRIRWWRDNPQFSQRWELSIDADGDHMQGRGEMSRDGAPWEPDLQLTYTRIT